MRKQYLREWSEITKSGTKRPKVVLNHCDEEWNEITPYSH